MNGVPSRLAIGSRGSPLALAQAEDVRRRLRQAHPALRPDDAITITIIRTTGDIVTDRTLSAAGGKGLFTKEIEVALAEGQIDLAVHSMKDVPTVLPPGLVIDCFLEREDPRDAFFASGADTLDTLAAGAVVGTASLRRQAQILYARPDVTVVPFRGNVETRLQKLADGTVDATLLAVAGLNRLGLARRIRHMLDPAIMLPAVAQGAVGIERRADDARVARLLAPLNHPETELRVAAERAVLAELDGSCRTPIGALAEIVGDTLQLTALVIRPDGTQRHIRSSQGSVADAASLGAALGAALKREAGPGFFDLPLPDQPAL